MTSKEIKDIKIMADGGGMITPKKLIYSSNLVFPLPKIQGVTIKGLFDVEASNKWKKGILMSSDGIVKNLDEYIHGDYTPLENVMSKNDILIIDYFYGTNGGPMTWKWGDGQTNYWDIWPDRNWDGHFKVETSDYYEGLATFYSEFGDMNPYRVNTIENLYTDQGLYHVVGLYEIEEN